MKEIDALDNFIKLHDGEENLIKAIVESSLFFKKEYVKTRNKELNNLIKNKSKLFVRYSLAFNNIFNIKNKKEGKKFTRDNTVRIPASPFNMIIDNDGNAENRRIIKKLTNHKVSSGVKSSIKNYIISHVWGITDNPLFFSSLWNIVLIPVYYNFILDKNDEHHDIVKRVKDEFKLICIKEYDPYNEFIKNHDDSLKDLFNIKNLNNNYEINFI